jgi:hypothetical protein
LRSVATTACWQSGWRSMCQYSRRAQA